MPDQVAALSALPSWIWIAIPIILTYFLGIWMGTTERLVIYRNYYDVLVVGLLYVIPITAFSFAALLGGDDTREGVGAAVVALALGLEAVVFVIILARAWRDNPNPLKALLALYVKIPTAVLFLNALFGAFDRRKAKDRRRSVLWLILMTPLIHALVRDKKTGRLPGLPRRY